MILAVAALFEVSDKEPTSILGMWVFAAVLGIGGYFVAQRFRWVAAGVVFVEIVGFWAALGELNDPFVGPAIMQESGSTHYFWHLCGATALGAVLPMIGVLRARMRRASEPRAG